MCFNCALAWHYDYGDPRRSFGQGTPKEVWCLMEQTWAVAAVPTNARITKDISGWERVCDKIIEAKGCIAPDENFRTGRRSRKMHVEGDVISSCASATARPRTCLTSRCTPLSRGPTRTSWGPRGAGRRRRGPSSV
jgi:hypothetical protein